MANRITVKDVAKEAGVSVSTVDRVLNGREKVREETARIVYEGAQRVGYHAAGLIGQRILAELPEMTFGFVFHKRKQEFYQKLVEHIEQAVRDCPLVRGRVEIEFSPSQAPSDFAKLIRNMAGRADAVAATAITHHDVTEAVVDLKKQNIPTFAVLNDFAQNDRQAYIGLNNMKAGRIASWMIATAAKPAGKVGVFVGGHRWHGHELREMGFRTHFREYSPEFEVLDTLVNLETRQLTYEATLDLLSRHKDLRGLYIAGGGMEGAITALREMRAPGEVAFVVSELTSDSRKALADRYLTMAVATPLEKLSRDLVQLMAKTKLTGESSFVGQRFLEPQIYLPESP